MLKNVEINGILKIIESYQAPQKMLDLMLNDVDRLKTFETFLKIESDLSYEWFQNYFENEHSDRKVKKQDFTPQSISELGSELIGQSDTYFEATAGTGGMLVQFWRNNKESYFEVEELSDRAIPFLLFNMAIRNVSGLVRHSDSLTQVVNSEYRLIKGEQFSSIEIIFDGHKRDVSAILMNPPYSAEWSADKRFLDDPRFKAYGKLAPKSKADFAFVLHGFSRLKAGGTMAVVLPHGVLFRGAAEGEIRKRLLEEGAIAAVIGLPEKLFLNTSIPTVLIILKKNRVESDILFIDASKDFEKGKSQNFLRGNHLEKIQKAYASRKAISKYSHLANFDELVENDFNLNIPRYVDTFEEEEPIDLVALAEEYLEIDRKIKENEKKLLEMVNELTGDESMISAAKSILSVNIAGQIDLL